MKTTKHSQKQRKLVHIRALNATKITNHAEDSREFTRCTRGSLRVLNFVFVFFFKFSGIILEINLIH